MSALRASVLALLAAGVAVCAAACTDPVHDNEVQALGPEAAGVSPGPLHRPGQPCLTCHDGTGPGNAVFVAAGTVYLTLTGSDAVSGATVQITDSSGVTKTTTTNAAGNFYFRAEEWTPVFPLHDITVSNDQQPGATMTTRIGRDGSCATCHFTPRDSDAGRGGTTPGHVYLFESPDDVPQPGGQ